MGKIVKLNRVYEKNAPKLQRWANDGLAFAVLISEKGRDDITPLFKTFKAASEFSTHLRTKGINNAVAETIETPRGPSYRLSVTSQVARQHV